MTLKKVQRTLTLGLVLLAANSYAQTVPAGYASTSVTNTLPAKSPAVVADDSIRPFHMNVGFVSIRNFGFLATGGVPRPCPFAFSCWARHNNRMPNNTLLPPKTPPIFIAAPSVVDQ
jgi:hypothetical protein